MSLLLALASLCVSAASQPLVCFDLKACLETMPEDSVFRYDAVKLVASLQGVVNRDAPRLVIRFLDEQGAHGPINVDDYYLELFQKDWLKDTEIVREKDLAALLRRFPEAMNGAVLWDQEVLATANVAATVCGVEGWMPVRAGGAFAAWLAAEGLMPPVKLDLTGKFTGAESGSAKCDAYLWAKREYLDAGKCHPALMANYIDAYTQAPGQPGFTYTDLHNATLANHDFYIAHRAFFFDLGVWEDEAPVDDPGQPLGTDKKTLIALLKSQFERNGGKTFTSVGGFTPWNLKYTNHGVAGGKHEPVPTEWEYAAILSAHNALMDADALGLSCLANASAWRHHPLEAAYKQNPRPAKRTLEDKTYILVYMGDYDSAAWLSRTLPRLWDDPARGRIPIAWAFNPNLAERVPYVFDHIYRTKSENDWFIGGDSGAGYINPNLLTGERLGSGLPDALELWVTHNQNWYTRFDYSITGFVINGFHGDMPLRLQEAYTKFSPDGVGMQLGFEEKLVNGTPFLRHSSDIYPDGRDLSKAAGEMARFARKRKPQFIIFRWILQSPTTLETVARIMREEHPEQRFEFCDPHTFFDLYRQSLK